jgi:hypothetical protein
LFNRVSMRSRHRAGLRALVGATSQKPLCYQE